MGARRSEKDLMRDPVPCKDDTRAGLRTWYESFNQYCFMQGYYVHPFNCFRKDHGGVWGFSAGDDAEDDLPQRMVLQLDDMKSPIHHLLSKSDMFPKDSCIATIVAQCFGNGYKAIKQILMNSHPIFHD